MPSITGIGVIGITPNGCRHGIDDINEFGGPLNVDEAIFLIRRKVQYYDQYTQYEKFEFYDLKLSKSEWLRATLLLEDIERI